MNEAGVSGVQGSGINLVTRSLLHLVTLILCKIRGIANLVLVQHYG
jgi:hypothetical protein